MKAESSHVITEVISKSIKMRSGAKRVFENGKLVWRHDGFQRHWKMVVTKYPTGGKNRKGQPAYDSFTEHIPA